jgi:hypothetical protein
MGMDDQLILMVDSWSAEVIRGNAAWAAYLTLV